LAQAVNYESDESVFSPSSTTTTTTTTTATTTTDFFSLGAFFSPSSSDYNPTLIHSSPSFTVLDMFPPSHLILLKPGIHILA